MNFSEVYVNFREIVLFSYEVLPFLCKSIKDSKCRKSQNGYIIFRYNTIAKLASDLLQNASVPSWYKISNFINSTHLKDITPYGPCSKIPSRPPSLFMISHRIFKNIFPHLGMYLRRWSSKVRKMVAKKRVF